jgi:uncharacterized protein (TIGR02391 family)
MANRLWKDDMHTLEREDLINMEPEELGIRMLFVLKDLSRNNNGNAGVHMSGTLARVAHTFFGYQGDPIRDLDKELEGVFIEAWVWLESQGLLIPSDPYNGANGWRKISRRARTMTSMEDFVPYAISRRIDPKMLSERFRGKVWSAFIRGHFDVAASIAMKEVEVAVREAAGYRNDKYGVQMMRDAFHANTGPLSDQAAEPAEREARSALFAGAIGVHKNPLSHRNVPLDDASEAVEVVLLANHLIRIVERQRQINLEREANVDRPDSAS